MWLKIHRLALVVWVMAWLHGVLAGTDSGPLALLYVAALVRLPPDFDYWVDLFPPLVGFAVALGLTVAPLTTTVLNDAGPGDAGIASGVNNAVARIAGLIAIAVIGVAAAGGSDHLSLQGFHRTTTPSAPRSSTTLRRHRRTRLLKKAITRSKCPPLVQGRSELSRRSVMNRATRIR